MTAADPNWNYVTLMLHGEDDFVDTVTNTSGTMVGTPTIETSIFQFGSGSIYCSSGNYLTFSDDAKWDFGTGAFTIEFDVYFVGSPNNRVLLGQGTSGQGWRVYTNAYGNLYFRYNDGSSNYDVGPTNITLQSAVWYRIAIVRNEYDQGYLYLNGTRSGYIAYSYTHDITGSANDMAVGPSLDACLDEIRITKGLARYFDYTYTLSTEPFPDSDHPQYGLRLTEAAYVESAAYAGPGSLFLDRIIEPVFSADMVNTLEKPTLVDIIRPSDTPIWVTSMTYFDTAQLIDDTAITLSTAIKELIRAQDASSLGGTFGLLLSDIVRVLEFSRVGSPIDLSDAVTVAWALNVSQGFRIAEQLKISEMLNFPVVRAWSFADTIRLRDSLANFFNFDLSETLTVQETMTGLARHIGLLSEPITAADELASYFMLSATAQDDAILDDAFDLSMIFNPTVLEQIRVSALFVEPNGGVTTWAVNTRTGAVSEYTGYDFNSFAQNNRFYLGASTAGLYQLDGDDDAGEPVIAQLRSGYAQFGGSRYTSFKAAYLGLRSDGSVFLKLDTGDGKAYTYKAVVQNQQSTKVRFGKGLRARYFAFELITEGQDFDLDTIEFLPVVAQRRV